MNKIAVYDRDNNLVDWIQPNRAQTFVTKGLGSFYSKNGQLIMFLWVNKDILNEY